MRNLCFDQPDKIIEAASKKNIIIAYIRQKLDGLWGRMLSNLFAGGTAIKGNPETEIDKRISISARGDHVDVESEFLNGNL